MAQVEIVSAGQFSEEIVKRASGGDEKKMGTMMLGMGVFLVTGIPPGMLGGGGKKKKKDAKPEKTTRTITFARIVTTTGEQFAFSPDHFDFSGLAEKKQLKHRCELPRPPRGIGQPDIREGEPRCAPSAGQPLAHLRQLHRPP